LDEGIRMSTSRVLVLLAAASLASPFSTWAQRRSFEFQSLDIEQLIKLRTINHGIHIGRVTGFSGDSLFLRPERGSDAVELAAIEQLWVRRTATKKGAVIGGVTGAILGALSFAFMSYAVCDAASCSVDLRVTGIGVVAGGVFGSITGAVFGAMFGQWHSKYP
jgi:hypothetical protein